MLGSQEEAIMAANTQGEEGVVADFALEDEVFKELEPHKDPDVLACFETFTATLFSPETCPWRLLGLYLIFLSGVCPFCYLFGCSVMSLETLCTPSMHLSMQAKLERRLQSVDVEILNPPRPGKKLMVTDIDYTIFDLGSAAEQPMQLAR